MELKVGAEPPGQDTLLPNHEETVLLPPEPCFNLTKNLCPISPSEVTRVLAPFNVPLNTFDSSKLKVKLDAVPSLEIGLKLD